MTYAVLGNNLVRMRDYLNYWGPLKFDLDIIINY